MENEKKSVIEHFKDVKDPRNQLYSQHPLETIIVIAICAVICGANDWVGIEAFGKAKKAWLGKILNISHGIPSHDTFGRVFAGIKAEEFETCFINWLKSIAALSNDGVVAIDGKCLRRSHDRGIGKKAICLVSAWASQAGFVLGQVKTTSKSNEITAIPQLLQKLVLKGCIVTIDAIACQTGITETIVNEGADYIIALKGNQGKLHREVVALYQDIKEKKSDTIPFEHHQQSNLGHGRIETRHCFVINDKDFIAYLNPAGRWRNLQSVVMIASEKRLKNTVTHEMRYYISSLNSSAAEMNLKIRTHWEIESKVHWILDVAFREDDSRLRQGDSAENFAVLRRIALNLIRHDNSKKGGIQNKRLQAGWDERYLEKILFT